MAICPSCGQRIKAPRGQPKGYRFTGACHATRLKGAKAAVANANAFAESLRPLFAELDALSATAVAVELTKAGIATARRGKWEAATVINIRKRLARQTIRGGVGT